MEGGRTPNLGMRTGQELNQQPVCRSGQYHLSHAAGATGAILICHTFQHNSQLIFVIKYCKGMRFLKIYKSCTLLQTVLKKEPYGLESIVYSSRFAYQNLSENIYEVLTAKVYAFSFVMQEPQLVVMPVHGSILSEIWIKELKER